MSSRLSRLVVEDLRHNWRHFALASIGVILGTAALAFFVGLGAGVRTVVLGDVFPVDRIEVVPRAMGVGLGPVRVGMGADALDEDAVAALAELAGVTTVYPKMRMTVPAIASGGRHLLGKDLSVEMVADGVEPALVAGDVGADYSFSYPASEEKACTSDDQCGKQHYCRRTEQGMTCRAYVPVLMSQHVLELYNGAIRRSHDLPQINPDFVLGMTFDIEVGASMVEASQRENVSHERGMLVGFSDKAIPLGLTMPIGFIKQFNAQFGNEAASRQYHSAILEVASKDQVGPVAQGVKDLGFSVADHGAEQAGLLIAILTAVFALISTVIVTVAAINVMHLFLMLVYRRQHEIGLMRAVGASRADIRRLIFGEAAVVGALAGTLGAAVAVLGAWAADFFAGRYIPDFPYKPDTFFQFDAWILLGTVAVAVVSCLLGAVLPARRAAGLDPAIVLTGR